MIGVSMRTTQKKVFKNAVALGKEYKKVKNQNLIYSCNHFSAEGTSLKNLISL